jgi:hypothetical protein
MLVVILLSYIVEEGMVEMLSGSYTAHTRRTGGGWRCSGSVSTLLCLLVLTQSVPYVDRMLLSLTLNGAASSSPMRRAIPEVSNGSADGVVARPTSQGRPNERAPVEEADHSVARDKVLATDWSLPLSQLMRCRELPRSHPCSADGVIVLCA